MISVMAAEDKVITFRAGQDLQDGIQSYEERYGYESRSEAVQELAQIGLREAKNPILYRLKDRVIEGSWYLALLSVVVVVAGHLTTVLSPGNSIMLAAVLLAVAAALIACLELLRTINGQSELGAAFWGVVGR